MRSTTSEIEYKILGNDVIDFSFMQKNGFQPLAVLTTIKEWPKGPSTFKLEILADAILNHYQYHPEYAEGLSLLLSRLKKEKKESASYGLAKILGFWLHQRWASLPCSNLSIADAHALFPQHALAPSNKPLQQIFTPANKDELFFQKILASSEEKSQSPKPFAREYFGLKYMSVSLTIPKQWAGKLDAFRPVLDVIPEPKIISDIGFGTGEELGALRYKWPKAELTGFESGVKKLSDIDKDMLFKKNSAVIYDSFPQSYCHKDQNDEDKPADLVVIRHPNTLGDNWIGIAKKAVSSLSTNGTLLMTFFSENEMHQFKTQFLKQDIANLFLWSDKVNPHACNPAFISKSGTYSFDFFLVAIRPKTTCHPDPLAQLTPVKMRKSEIIPIEPADKKKKFVVVEHKELDIVSQPGAYEEFHRDNQYQHGTACIECHNTNQPSTHKNFYKFFNSISGKHPAYANVDFCPTHVPANKKEWENKLQTAAWSNWKNPQLSVHHFFLVGQGIAKDTDMDEEQHNENPLRTFL